MDQAHEIAWQLSQALQQHGRTCLVISPFLLSTATEIRATMNQGLVPQWDHVCNNDHRMESHLFFPKTAGYCESAFFSFQMEHTAAAPVPAPAPDPAPEPALAPEPAPTRLSVPPITSLPRISHSQQPVVPGTMTDKGKQSDRGTHRTTEDSPDTKSGRKKQKVLKCLSKAIISNTEDEDRQPTGTIMVKWAKVSESSGVAPVKSQVRFTLFYQSAELKTLQLAAEPKISQAQPKGKGKEKAVDITGPIRGRWPLRANDEEELIHSTMRQMHWGILPCCGRQEGAGHQVLRQVPFYEEVSVTGHDDAKMDLVTNAEQHTDIPTEMSAEAADQIMVDQPGAIASVDDFPHDHWLENSDNLPVPHVPPTHVADAVSLPLAPSAPTILECVLTLTAQVNAMQTADNNTLARVNAMEHDFDACISSICAELSAMQLDVGTTVTLVNGLVGLVEKLWQEQVLANPLFPPLMVSHGNDSTATAFSMRYLNSVFSPSIAPIFLSVGVGQTSASCSFGRPDMQGSTSISGNLSLASAHAGPSSTPAPGGSHFAVKPPPSAAHSPP
ncbi:hypothetical protein C8R48DRAFT_674069 [Suillus tomentosus]|nr:hypothetical protein C8R48DRAFT_674069 [Suillus tomentosus]